MADLMNDIDDGNLTDVPIDHAVQKPVAAPTRQLEEANDQDYCQEKDIDIGFLFASPIVLENHFPG